MGGSGSKDKKQVADLQGQLHDLQRRLSDLSSLAVPSWRLGDRKYFEVHEKAWERMMQANSASSSPTAAGGGNAAAVPHPSENRLSIGANADGVLSLDRSAPYGDDLVITALLLLRKSSSLHTLSMAGADLSDQGADLLAAALRHDPRAAPNSAPRCLLARVILADNPRVGPFGAQRLLQAILSRAPGVNAGGVLDLRGCGIYNGTADEVGTVEKLSEAVAKIPQFTLLLPAQPERPFNVDGVQVLLSAFVGGAEGYQPLSVQTSPTEVQWLHREDIKLKTEEKADALYKFLIAVIDEQTRRLGAKRDAAPMSLRKPYECGSCYLAPVRFTTIRAKLTVVAIVTEPRGKTYAQLLADATQSGISVPRGIKLQIFMQLCAAIAFSHQHNFAMRSLRPDLLMVALDHGAAYCQYVDYCALRPETLRSVKVQVGSRMVFTDPSVRAGVAISRSMDSYAAAMMVVFAYRYTDVLEDFKAQQYVWLNEQQRPVADQVPDALSHYQALGLEPDVAQIVVSLTRPDDRRMSCQDAAKEFYALLQAVKPS